MPTSDNRTISPILHKIIGVMPRSILDLGIGYGKYGALCREYVDFNREDGIRHIALHSAWKVFILGIEGFAEYRNPLWEIYSQVRVEDFSDRDNWMHYDDFDLVLLLDALEHLPDKIGIELLEFLRRHNRNVLVSVPEGEYPQDAMYGNGLECHRSVWTADKLQEIGGDNVEVFYRGETCSSAHFKQ